MTMTHQMILEHTNSTLHFVCGGEALLSDLPPKAIALDGYVQGPEIGADDRWSFDHHAKCIRLVTLATCQQVHLALSMGMSPRNRHIYINDLDGDTVLSAWLLANADLIHREDVSSLVRIVGLIDAHGPVARSLMSADDNHTADVFFQGVMDVVNRVERERAAHFNEWPSMLAECFGKLDRWLKYGEPVAVPTAPPSHVVTLHEATVDGLRMVAAQAEGLGAFHRLYALGYHVVLLSTPLADGSTRYTIGKLSDLVSYRLGPHTDGRSLLGKLRNIEGGWGGGSSIGGSPRSADGSSSKLTLEQVWTLLTDPFLVG
jgi:hypothetical protein